MDNVFFKTVICPICNSKLNYNVNYNALVCNLESLIYPIRDGIPILIKSKAKHISIN
ncbi:Trm112 family protein [Candidatus Pantoea edessiphila]|uniref:Uncharacterized protein n=1 Tax=Candidatus Pantoea edessiphila TaxID=2044610 RepID=A0A2P5SX00_9GAMM|nr:hypothetical protein CRV10_01230 [Candidatus Pantoea edessiphila]